MGQKARPARRGDVEAIRTLLASHATRRFSEIVESAIEHPGSEYITCVMDNDGEITSLASYGLVAGTIGTGTVHGVAPVTRDIVELLSFALQALREIGAARVVVEVPDDEINRSYRDALLFMEFEPAGVVEDYYTDGVGQVLFGRNL